MHAYPWTARLHHFALGTPDPVRLAEFYSTTLLMEAGEAGDFQYCHGPERHMLFAQGKASSLVFGAYSLANDAQLQARRRHLESKQVVINPSPSPLFDGRAFSFQDPEGNTIVLGVADDPPSAKRDVDIGARLQHLVLTSPEPEKLAGFYSDKVGFWPSDQAEDDDGVVRSIWLRTDHEHHSFAVFTGSSAVDHFSFELNDWNGIRDWSDYFSSFDIELIWGPGRHGPGNNLFIFIVDPDGNKIELSAEMDSYSVHRPLGVWPFNRKAYNLWGAAPLRVG